jgi:hypothetical protein
MTVYSYCEQTNWQIELYDPVTTSKRFKEREAYEVVISLSLRGESD